MQCKQCLETTDVSGTKSDKNRFRLLITINNQMSMIWSLYKKVDNMNKINLSIY